MRSFSLALMMLCSSALAGDRPRTPALHFRWADVVVSGDRMTVRLVTGIGDGSGDKLSPIWCQELDRFTGKITTRAESVSDFNDWTRVHGASVVAHDRPMNWFGLNERLWPINPT